MRVHAKPLSQTAVCRKSDEPLASDDPKFDVTRLIGISPSSRTWRRFGSPKFSYYLSDEADWRDLAVTCHPKEGPFKVVG